MDDLISREQATKATWQDTGYTDPFNVMTAIRDRIKQLPTIQPNRGKWIYHIDDLFPAESTMECNQCHTEQSLTCDDEFCPHCGAKMEVTE